jgi:hypothetical protein
MAERRSPFEGGSDPRPARPRRGDRKPHRGGSRGRGPPDHLGGAGETSQRAGGVIREGDDQAGLPHRRLQGLHGRRVFAADSRARVVNSCPLCYHLLQPQGAAGGLGAAKTKPHRLKLQSDSNGPAARNGPTGGFLGSHACGDPSGGGTGTARSTSHGSMKQEAASRLFRPGRVK